MSIDWQAFWLTLRLALIVSALLFAIGLPIAYWIAFSRWRWKFLIEAVVALPIVLPPTVLGFYLLVALGPHSPLGRWWISLTGHTLAFTFTGLVIGSILYSLPFAVQPFQAALKDKPETVNKNPHDSWMVVIKLTVPSEADALLDALRLHAH